MVFFTCSHCGESLQKPKVEKHYNTKCRGAVSVTCMDCLKDFNAETYVHHTKCISEEERYSAKGFTAKLNANKGQIKQEKWIETIQKILKENPKLPMDQRNILNLIVKHENTPRKKPKFMNFMKSVSPRTNPKDCEAVFDLLDKEHSLQFKQQQLEKKANGATPPQTNGNSPKKSPVEVGKTKSPKKSKETEDRFKWKPTILHFVKQKKSIKNKKLMEKVFAAYKSFHPELKDVPTDVIKKYHTKLSNMKKVFVENDLVKLSA